MNTKYGISILAEDCKKALKSVLQQISMLNNGDWQDVKDDVRLLEGLLEEKEITDKDIDDNGEEILKEEYNKTHSKCCDAEIKMGRCSECLEGV